MSTSAEIEEFLEDVPDEKLSGFGSGEKTLWKPPKASFRFDMQGINKDGKGYPIRLYVQPKGGESKKKHTATKSLSTKAVLAQIHTVDGTSPSDIRRALVESAEAEATLVKVGELDLPEEEEEAAEDKKGKKKKQSKGTNKPRKL